MSGAVLKAPPEPLYAPQRPSFIGVLDSFGLRHRPRTAWSISLLAHALVVMTLVIVPLLSSAPPPEHPDYVRALLYNPPPPPPPPLPKGSAMVEKPKVARPVTPDTKPDKPRLIPDVVIPQEKPLQHEAKEPETEQAGSPSGSESGVAEGMDIGIEGGVVGGVPGGVLGGVVGGTGDGAVLDYDQPPRPIKMPRPQYPQDAFVKKIEGTVEVEILIDTNGHVVRARVVRSIPLLDQAAIQAVYQWVFSPAVKNGHPVPTIARAPVAFRIY